LLDKTETVVVHLTWFAAIASAIVGVSANSAVLLDGSLALTVLMWGYSVYWALNLRRLLSAQLYRNQALGAGLIAIAWACFDLVATEGYTNSGRVVLTALAIVLVMTFYFIDSSVLAARKSDPLYRNTFHWRQLRFVVWPVIAISLLVLLVLALVSPSFLLDVVGNQPPVGAMAALAIILVFVPFFGTFGSALVLLPVSGRRSRDQTLRKNLEWFGLFGATIIGFLIMALLTDNQVSFYLLFVVGSYCLYRSTKSLAPLNRLSPK
jgi:hypothetical protein